MSESRSRYLVAVDIGGTHGSSVGGRGFRLAARVLADYRSGSPRASDTRLSRIAAENTDEGD